MRVRTEVFPQRADPIGKTPGNLSTVAGAFITGNIINFMTFYFVKVLPLTEL